MRAIDADAFKDYIRSGYEEMKHLFNENLKVATLITESFCKDIDEQPTVQPEPHWIPCGERLPENDNDVLVQMNDGSMMVDYRAASSNGWFWAELDDEPVAWMPLPEPWKGEVTE